MKDFLEMKNLVQGFPIKVVRIPKPIMKEIDVWVKECRKIKNNPLAELKAHENAGYRDFGIGKKYNSYQCSVPPHLIDEGFWLPWVLRLTAEHFVPVGRLTNRDFALRTWPGHYYGYDIWANFAYKGDNNPTHHHTGYISGVIYYKNHYHPTCFDDFNCAYGGDNGTMIMFPSDVRHHVKEQTSRKERITFAFNIQREIR